MTFTLLMELALSTATGRYPSGMGTAVSLTSLIPTARRLHLYSPPFALSAEIDQQANLSPCSSASLAKAPLATSATFRCLASILASELITFTLFRS